MNIFFEVFDPTIFRILLSAFPKVLKLLFMHGHFF